MRVAHAERRPWGVDDPDFHRDFRSRLGIVLSMDSKAIEGPPRQAGIEARCAFHAVPRNSHAGPLTWLRDRLSMFQRVTALEERMDGMADWLEQRGVK